jgi:alanyl-tRNA synthetase
MAQKPMSVAEIKAALVGFYGRHGYEICDSRPLLADDPSVMFINATITPFKHRYTSPFRPTNFALIQNCLRMGGASDLETVGVNPYYFVFFEMFGGGCFLGDARSAVRHILEALEVIGLDRQRLWFTVPTDDKCFTPALFENDISLRRIMPLSANGIFWQKWQFGKPGLTGHGLTAIYSRTAEEATTLSDLTRSPDEYLELLNVIHVHSWTDEDGLTTPLPFGGFDIGAGIERLAAAVQGCDAYHIDSMVPLIATVEAQLSRFGKKPPEMVVRICADHLRAAFQLAACGLKPSSKGPGYILRKLLRRVLIKSWLHFEDQTDINPLVTSFAATLRETGHDTEATEAVNDAFFSEGHALRRIIAEGSRIIKKHLSASPETLSGTYGLTADIIAIVTQKG